jgi:hypothetical protein
MAVTGISARQTCVVEVGVAQLAVASTTAHEASAPSA